MNDYPVWWNKTITVYNKFTDPQTKVVKWYRTVINDAFWKDVHEKVQIGQTVLDTHSIVCRIRKDDRFLEKYQWLQMPNDEMSKYFTLGKEDIIIRGEVTDEVNEYQSGKRSTDLIAKYKTLQGCMSIDECTNNTGEGLGMEHYVARGI